MVLGMRFLRMNAFQLKQLAHCVARSKLLTIRISSNRFIMTSCWTQAKKVQLACSPLLANMDEKVTIDVEGLEPNQKVSLQAKLVGDSNDRYHSLAHYIADQQGRVCLNSQPSVGGSYVGVEPMGFMWSLEPEPNQRPGRRLLKRDVTKPYLVDLALLDGHVDILKTENCHPLSSLTIERHYMSAGVRRIDVHEGRIRGTLFLPPGDGPFQGVIDLVGSHGGMVEFKAAQLASNGFAALALAYLNHSDLPRRLNNVQLEYFIEAVDWLKNHPSIIPGGVGVMGISKGAEISVLLASHCQDVQAVVSVGGLHGLAIVPMIFRDKLVPFIKFDPSKTVLLENGALKCRDCYGDDWTGRVEENPNIIPLEKASASFLIIYGTDDHAYNTELSAAYMYNRLKAFGKETQCSILGYHGAGHLIEPPYTPLSSMSYQKSFDMYLSWGGDTKAHANAQEHAWKRILSFLKENLPQRQKTTCKL